MEQAMMAGQPPFFAQHDLSNLQFARNLGAVPSTHKNFSLVAEHTARCKAAIKDKLDQGSDPDPQDCLAYAYCILAQIYARKNQGQLQPGDVELLRAL